MFYWLLIDSELSLVLQKWLRYLGSLLVSLKCKGPGVTGFIERKRLTAGGQTLGT